MVPKVSHDAFVSPSLPSLGGYTGVALVPLPTTLATTPTTTRIFPLPGPWCDYAVCLPTFVL